jgi:transposase
VRRTPASSAAPTPVAAGPAFSPRQTCWLLLRPADALTAEQRAYVAQVLHDCPKIALAQALTKEFAAVLDEHDVAGLYRWLHGVEQSGIPDLCAVVRGMWLDRSAIEAAVTSPWSQGQVEGQVNRLKLTKREGFGRCRFALLRRRVLHRAS